MSMSVRSKLALSTGLALLLLLLAFHMGSRLIFVRAFQQAEHELLRVMPTVKNLLLQDINRLHEVTEAHAANPVTIAFLKAPQNLSAQPIFTPELMRAMNLRLYALLDAGGRQIAGGSVDADSRGGFVPLSDSFRRYLSTNSPLATFSSSAPSRFHRGMLRADEGGLIVSATSVNDPQTLAKLGVLVLGRAADELSAIDRIADAIPGPRSGRRRVVLDISRRGSELTPLSPDMLKDAVELGGLLFWRKPSGALEARMPVYDIFGYPAFFLVFSLPRSISAGLAENTLAWLTLMVACTGMVFVIPLFVIQSRTVLNPLSLLTREIRSFDTGGLNGRRLNWRRKDEFGQVARSVDQMLDGMESGLARIEAGERQHRAFLDAIPDIFYVVDRQGVIRDAHAKHGSRLGNQTTALIGRRLCDTGLVATTWERLRACLRNVLTSGHPETLDFHLTQPDGSLFWGELRIVRMDDDHGIIIERNISDRHQMEENHRRIGEQQIQAHKMESLGILAGGIAHDFNNILTAIIGHADLIDLALPANVQARSCTENIRHAAMRASGLTRRIMTYAGKGDISTQALDLNRLLDDMVSMIRTSLSRKANIEIQFASDLPPVMGDATQLWQVTMNLLINASDALGNNPGRITLATRRIDAQESDLAEVLGGTTPLKAGVYAVLEVADTGKGMDIATRVRIFDPFFSTKSSGRGLGLSTVLGIVRAHGGGIRVESTPGVGTIFRIFLPATAMIPDSEAEGAAPTLSTLLPAMPAGRTGRPIVLLAEDEPDIRRTLTQTLVSAGFEVLAVANGERAVALFKKRGKDIAIVLMNVEMPETSGEEALRAIRRISSETRAFVVSGHDVAMLKERFAHLDVTGFISKPFTHAQLLEALDAASWKSG